MPRLKYRKIVHLVASISLTKKFRTDDEFRRCQCLVVASEKCLKHSTVKIIVIFPSTAGLKFSLRRIVVTEDSGPVIKLYFLNRLSAFA